MSQPSPWMTEDHQRDAADLPQGVRVAAGRLRGEQQDPLVLAVARAGGPGGGGCDDDDGAAVASQVLSAGAEQTVDVLPWCCRSRTGPAQYDQRGRTGLVG